MRRKCVALSACAALLWATSLQAANIIWVSWHPDDDTPSAGAAAAGFTEAPDAGYTQLLQANGHAVTRVLTSGNPNTNLLNAADLVIISRSVPSADYETDAETAAWNGITAPMILINGFVARSNRLGFATGATILDTGGAVKLQTVQVTHPIFAGIALGPGGVTSNTFANIVSFNNVAQRGISVNMSPIASGGTVLATINNDDATAGGVAIAEWPAGAVMANSPPDTLGGRRLMFLTGSREATNVTAETAGIYDLTPTGAQLFLNAVNYMAPAPTYRGAVIADGPIAYYRFSDPGTNAINSGSLAASANGVYLNGASNGVQAPRPPQFAGFESNNTALSLDGLDDFVRGTAGLLNNLSNVTLSTWIRRTGAQRNRTGLLGQDNVVEFGYIVNNTLQAWVDNFSTPVNVTNPFPDLEWEHAALVVDGASLRMTVYTNGQPAGTASLPSANYTSNTNWFVVGGDAFGNNGVSFGGQMDEAAVFNKALTASQISDHYYSALIVPPTITGQPVGTNIHEGQTIRLSVGARGTPRLRYQWLYGTSPLAGQIGSTLLISNAIPAQSGGYSVIVENNYGGSQSAAAMVNVAPIPPPIAKVEPVVTNVPPGGSVTFCLDIAGIGPFEIQWRHNGVNIPGETNLCLVIDDVQLADGGNYTAAVANNGGVVISDSALLLLELPPVQGADSITNRVFVGGDTGLISGTNTAATSSPTEPRHFDKPGGKSVWYEWSSPQNGICTFQTIGSTFDTLLAVYILCDGNLVEMASDDDSAGNLASRVAFNVIEGARYLIAVDGFGGADGQFAVNWQFEPADSFFPVIHEHPASVTVGPGEDVTFLVDATPGCPACDPCEEAPSIPELLRYQWYRDGVAIDGATAPSFAIANVDETHVGSYTVAVSQSGRTNQSRAASLQLNLTGGETQPAQAENKFEDAAESLGIQLGVGAPALALAPGPAPAHAPPMAAASTVVRGYTGTQVFSTAGGTTEPGDAPICGVIGGASKWITFIPLQTGVLHLNTDGSSYNTVMGVFVRSLNSPSQLQFVDCDNNSGLDGRDSALAVPVVAGVTNFIMVDGVNGQTGTLRLNYSLVITSAITVLGTTPQGYPQLRITGRPELNFTLEVSADMVNWTPLITTNSVTGSLDYTDDTSPPGSQRMYRALMLP